MNPISARDVFMDVSEATFSTDEATGKMMATVRIIKAGRPIGKNRDYTSQSLRRAAKEGVYNGVRMYIDHSSQPPIKRKMRELVSAVESTAYDPKTDSITGNVEFFNKEFYDYAQRAKKHIGVSADHRLRVNYVREGQDQIEQVQEITMARSVDWVVYPAAGGEILSFVQEGEGEDEVEWNQITAEQLKEHAPELYKAIAGTAAQEGQNGDKGKEGGTEGSGMLTQEAVTKLVQEAIAADRKAENEKVEKRQAAAKQYQDYISKAGLPQLTQRRLTGQFADALEYVEADVKAAVDEAKEELKAAGAGPRVQGMGASGSQSTGTPASTMVSARESVESFFGVKKPGSEQSGKKEN